MLHVSPLIFDPGDQISGGGWGRRVRSNGVGHTFYFRELELERSRRRISSVSPSRWTALFAFDDLAAANSFAQQQASREVPHHVYEVTLDPAAKTIRVPMDLLDDWWNLREEHEIEAFCDNYWLGHGQGRFEVLVDLPVTVVKRLGSYPF